MGAIMAVKSIVAVLGIALASTAAASAQTQAPLAGTYDVSDEGLVKSLPGFVSSFATVNGHPTALCRGR
jgi:ABC-type tungstate transport system permease subunit